MSEFFSNCAQAREAMDDLIDGLAGDDVRVLLEAHTGGCSTCRVTWGQMRSLDAGLTELREATAALGQVKPSCATVVRRFPVARFWRAAAAIAIGVGVGLVALQRTGSGVNELVQRRVADGVAVDVVLVPARRFEVVASREFIAISEETKQPNVHLVWLHKTVHVAADEAETSPQSRNGGREVDALAAGAIGEAEDASRTTRKRNEDEYEPVTEIKI